MHYVISATIEECNLRFKQCSEENKLPRKEFGNGNQEEANDNVLLV